MQEQKKSFPEKHIEKKMREQSNTYFSGMIYLWDDFPKDDGKIKKLKNKYSNKAKCFKIFIEELQERISVKPEKLERQNIQEKRFRENKLFKANQKVLLGIAPISPNAQDAQIFLEGNLSQSNHFQQVC